jgi:hypothetical protein
LEVVSRPFEKITFFGPDPLVVVLVLHEWVAPKPMTELALKSEFNKVSKLAKAWARQGKQAG